MERWIQSAGPHGRRSDLFGIIDIIALDPERGVIGVQSCGDSFSAHFKKLTEEQAQECVDWLSTPGAVLELWSWTKRKRKLASGWSKAHYWTPRIRELTLEDFDGEEVSKEG